MRRTLGAITLAIVALAWPHVHAQRQASPDTAAQLAQARADGLARSQVLAAAHGLSPNDIRVASAHVDALSMAHTRVQQMHQGIPVLGGEAIAHFRPDGSLLGETDSFVDDISVDPTPALTSEKAADVAVSDYGCSLCLTDTAQTQLWILRQDGVDHLVYRVQLSRLDGSPASALPVRFIDAHSGSVVLAYDNLQTGTGSSLYSGTVNIGTTFNPSNMQFHMENLALHIGTFNLNGATNPAAFARLKDADDTWDTPNKQAGVDAHYAAEKFIAYLFLVHGRNGLDGAGGPRTTPAFDGSGGLISSMIHYGTAFNDAFWNPIANVVVYGDGDGATFSPPVSLDLAGHELTHGLTQFTSGLLFTGESGALNESWSDVFGAMLERNVKGESTNTWRIGEDAYTPGTPGDAVRYLDNPHQAVDGGLTADDDPDHYSERYLGAADNGGIHHNSGIANKAFYLVAQGGSHHLGGSMTGIGADDAARIWFLALTSYMTTTTNFVGARQATLDAAIALFGSGSAQHQAVNKAWCLVGVGGCVEAVSVTPNSGSGMDQTFTATFTDQLGVADVRGRMRLAGPNGTACIIEYNAATNQVRLQDDTGVWMGGVTLPSGGSMANSQCTLNLASTTADESGNTLTLSAHLTFSGAFVGTKTISLMARTTTGQSTGWVDRGTWTVGVALEAIAVTPNSGTGRSQLFTATYSDSGGASDLRARIRFAGASDPGPCLIEYNATTDLVCMQDDAGAWTNPVPLGSGTLVNSQCTLNLALSSAVESGNGLTLAVHLTFSDAFIGPKTISLMARSANGQTTGWVTRGTWNAGVILEAIAVNPDSGTGFSQLFTATYSDSAGASDLRARIRFAGASGTACIVEFNAATNQVRMQDDTGAWMGGVTLPSGGSMANSQCTLDLAQSSAVKNGNNLTLALQLLFSGSFGGTKTTSLMALATNGQNTGWVARGMWTVPVTLLDGSVTPNSGSGLEQTFTAVYTDTAGVSDLLTARLRFTGANQPGPCLIEYNASTNLVTMQDDTGAFMTPRPFGIGQITNSQCRIDLTDSGAVKSGNTLTLTLHLTFHVDFSGNKVVSLMARNNGGQATAWLDRGTWNVPGNNGVLINGYKHTGAITTPGEVDTWTFSATAGDRITVHIGEITDTNGRFGPWIRLTSPTSVSLGDASGASAAVIDDVVAPATGTYTVRVASFNTGFDGTGTYRLSMSHTPGPILIAPGDEGGPLINGAIQTGTIERGDVDAWTFTATAGDRIAIHVGEITDTNGAFGPWIRLWAPTGATLGDTAGAAADVIDDVVAPATGTYLVLVASFNTGFNGTGTYRLTMTHTPGPITVSPGDQGGPLTNGGMHTGTIDNGDVDVWTFSATAGDRIAVHIGEITDTNGAFGPWIRLWAPTGATLGDTAGAAAAVIDDVVAPATGTYLVLVASFNTGFNGTGTYRLTMTHTPGPITVSPGDDGGPLTNGGMHTGTIDTGDVDVWTFNATAGDRIAVHIGEVTDPSGTFGPWIRLWAPTGATLGDTAGASADVIDDVVAPVTGTYLVLVASFNTGFNGNGTYRLTMTHTPGPITVSPGDDGGPLTNGGVHTGTIQRGDVDVWTFDATAGERIAVHIGEITDTNGAFGPWIRLWSPTGATLGDTAGAAADVIDDVVAPVTGTYLVLVASFNTGFNGQGTYRLSVTHTALPVTVSPGDEGGPLTNGGMHTGTIDTGDVDLWTFEATAGDRISVHIGEITDTNGAFGPWIRLWSPTGTSLGDTAGAAAAVIDDAVAPATGTYFVLVASFNTGFHGTGTYRLSMTHTPGPITVSPGDQGGPLTVGVPSSGTIQTGDVDVYTVTATAGDHLTVSVGEVTDTNGAFGPWIRLWAPNGASLGDVAGASAAVINNVTAPVSGTYLVLVASFNTGFNGTGTYNVTVTGATGP